MVNPPSVSARRYQDLVALAARLYEAGKLVEAEAAYRQILEMRPDLAEACHNLAKVLEQQGKLDQAVALYRRAIVLKPGLSQPHFNLGALFKQQGRLDESEAEYRQAIQLRPDDADAHNNIGNVLKGQGKFAEAQASFERALALRPDFAEAHYNRASLKTFVPGDPDLAALETLAAHPGKLPPAKLPYIHFGLGEAYDDIQQYDRAFEHYLQGCALRRQEIRYDELFDRRVFWHLLRVFNTPLIQRYAGAGDPSPLPIFILGMPRSGSTLIEQILASHPLIYGAGELRNMSSLVERPWRSAAGSLSYPDYVPLLRPADLTRLGQEYLASLPPLPEGKTRLADKAPGNFWNLGLIRLALPNAKIIHTVRDPIDTCVSCFSKYFSVGHTFSYDLAELGRYYRRYSDLMAHWHRILPAGAILDVAYEDVVDDLEGQARRLVEFCGLPWDDRCLSFHKTERPVITASNVQVRQPLYRTAVARWRRYERHLGPLRAALEESPAPLEDDVLPILAEARRTAEQANASGAAASVSNQLRELAAQAQNAQRDGRLDEAVEAYGRILAISPNLAEVHNDLGNVLCGQGKFDEAQLHYERAVALRPSLAEAHNNLGNLLSRRQSFDRAVAHYTLALALKPDFPEAHNNLGNVLVSQGKIDEAAKRYEQAVALNPNYAEAQANLGTVRKEQHRFDEAAQHLRQAIALRPNNPEAHAWLGRVRESQGDLNEAAARYRQAIALRPNFILAYHDLGNLLRRQGQLEEALATYQQALVVAPNDAQIHNVLGNIFKEQGKFELATASFERALALDPTLGTAHYNRADLKTLQPGDPDLRQLESLAANPGPLSEQSLACVHFALGKALDHVGEYHRAFESWLKANALRRRGIDYDETGQLEDFRQVIDTFDSPLFRRLANSGDPSSLPIFIVGMPRSGSTLVEQILASHPAVHGAGELRNLSLRVGSVRDESGQPIPFPQCVAHLDAVALRHLGRDYLVDLPTLPKRKTRVTDKTLSNFWYIGLIRLILPNARIIHTTRDPLDTCLSCFSTLFTVGHPFTYDLAELGRYYRHYRQLMDHWQSVLPAETMLDVRYEDVVENLEQQARRLLDYCGLPSDDRCLSFHKTERPVATASSAQVRQPLYRRSVGRWRRYEAELAPLRAELARGGGPGGASPATAEPNAEPLAERAATGSESAAAHGKIGAALAGEGKPDQALPHFERARALRPDLAETHYNLGTSLRALGNLDRATECFQQALTLRPDYAAAHNELGRILKEQGQFAAARQQHDRALTADPMLVEAHWNRAGLKTYRADDPDLAALERLAADPALPPTRLSFVHFALGKALDDVGQYDRAFAHWLQANALQRRQFEYDPAQDEAFCQRITQVFDAMLLERLQGTGDPSPLPIFILGMPRSGTSLVEQILASHPLVHGGGELKNLPRITHGNFQSAGQSLAYPEFAAVLEPDNLRRLAQVYLGDLPALPAGKTRITDKMPSNYRDIGLIRLMLPGAKIIHTMRDPRDTCLSCFVNFFEVGHRFSYDLAELGRRYRSYHRLMEHWRAILPTGAMLDLSYEALVDDLEGQVRRLLDYCGLPWDEACLNYHQNERPVRTSSNVQVRQPLYRGSIARWRRYESHLGPLLAQLEGCLPKS